MLDKLKNLSTLKRLLTKRNLGYLDIALSILTEKEDNQAYATFWKQFSRYFPHPDAAEEAWQSLRELRIYVRKELNNS